MNEWKEYIVKLLVFIGAVILCSFVISLFQKQPKENKYFDMILALKDSINEGIKRERDSERRHSDEKISLLQQRDTVLIREYKINTIKYAAIPNVVNNLSDAELARAVEEFR